MIVVTGGAGFIGYHVINALLARGESVLCIDNLNNYYDISLKKARLSTIRNDILFFQADISNYSELSEIFEQYPHKITAIYHLAAQAGVRYSLENPQVYLRSNFVATGNILECARKYAISEVIIASTSSVYGNAQRMPCSEDDESNAPVSLYAATKRGGEILASHYSTLHNINTCCLRFFTVYGPWGRPDMALFSFTKNILEGKAIELYNNGDMWRDFTYIADIVDGFIRAADYIKNKGDSHIFNLGYGRSVQLLDFLRILEKKLGKKANITLSPMQAGDVYKTWADTTRAQNLLGFSPSVGIEEGIANFVHWYKKYYDNTQV